MSVAKLTIDDFLPKWVFEGVDEFARAQDYTGGHCPNDGVTYPDVCEKIPTILSQYVQAATGLEIETEFFRLTTENTAGAPHQAHTDSIMGRYTFILYMQDGEGGTSLVRHKETGMNSNPESAYELRIWERDTNVPEAWDIEYLFEMKANRAVMYPSRMMHRAEPIGGFGDSARNGRLVYTAFLS